MRAEDDETLLCVDCGKRATRTHPGAVSAPADEGHVRHTRVPLCDRCAELRVAAQEPTFV